MIKIKLPVPPTINNYYATVGKIRVMSEKGKAFKDAVWIERMEREGIFFPSKEYKLKGKIEINIEYILPDRRKRDLDNIIKPLLDSLVHARYFEDDSQIYKLSIKKVDNQKKEDACVYVDISPLIDNTLLVC